MTLDTPAADAMYAQVVASLADMDPAGIGARVHAQLTRLDERKTFEVTAKDASRADLVQLAARTIVRARLSTRLPSIVISSIAPAESWNAPPKVGTRDR
ncbi:MAG: hypothetical protein ACLP1X_34555 [Polyangiaceae bacterium]|jgi:hypothetical protein